MLPRVLILADDVFSQRTLLRELDRIGQVATVQTLADGIAVLEKSDANTVLVCDTRAALREQRELHGCDTSIGARMLFVGGGTWDPNGAALAIGMRASLLEKPFVKGDVRASVARLLAHDMYTDAALSA